MWDKIIDDVNNYTDELHLPDTMHHALLGIPLKVMIILNHT